MPDTLLPEYPQRLERTQRLLQEDAVGMAIAKSPLISLHSSSHPSACLFFLECSAGCFCFILLIGVGFYSLIE